MNPKHPYQVDWTRFAHPVAPTGEGDRFDPSRELPLMIHSPQVATGFPWTAHSVARCLALRDPALVEMLLQIGDQVRAATVGDGVHLRALIEISNHCERSCTYCGLFRGNKQLGRYRLDGDLILEVVDSAGAAGYGTVVLQSGEDSTLDCQWVGSLISSIRARHGKGLAVTLSLGERDREELEAWKEAGADRYLLKQETVDARLYASIHPNMDQARRMNQLGIMKELGYQIGSGVMVGLPGQTWEILARDLLFMKALDMDMAGCGPLILHPDTPLARQWPQAEDGCGGAGRPGGPGWQVEPNVENSLKVVAMTRILMPHSLLPVTTSLSTLDSEHGRERALGAGANVIMPDLTPVEYEGLYDIYPGKTGTVGEKGRDARERIGVELAAMGRYIAPGPGHRAGTGDSPNT